jgi:hypothetical protein
MSTAGIDEQNAQCDHDRLVELKTRFEEHRSTTEGQITKLNELTLLKEHFEEYRSAIDARLEKLNELRGQVETDRVLYLRADVYDVRQREIVRQGQEMALRLDNYLRAEVFNVRHGEVIKRAEELTARVLDLERWQSRMLGISGTLITVAFVIGTLVGRFKW